MFIDTQIDTKKWKFHKMEIDSKDELVRDEEGHYIRDKKKDVYLKKRNYTILIRFDNQDNEQIQVKIDEKSTLKILKVLRKQVLNTASELHDRLTEEFGLDEDKEDDS